MKIGRLVLNIFPNVKGWFAHIGQIIFQPITVRNTAVIILTNAIEDIPNTKVRHAVKSTVQFNATLNNVEPYIHKMVEKYVHSFKRGRKK